MKVKRGTLLSWGLILAAAVTVPLGLSKAWGGEGGKVAQLFILLEHEEVVNSDLVHLVEDGLTQRRVEVEEVQRVNNDAVDCVLAAVFFEARGEPVLGKQWVFHVINNRALLGYRGKNTWCDVVYDYKQFSFANEDPNIKPDFTRATADLQETVSVVEDIMENLSPYDPTDCATHYLKTSWISKTLWAVQAEQGRSPEGLVRKGTVGNHTFYGPDKCAFRE